MGAWQRALRARKDVAMLTEQQLLALRRKLEALGYTQPLDPVSGPLVQALVDDLVHTTESYRQLKLQCAKQAQELGAFESKASQTLLACALAGPTCSCLQQCF